MLEGIGPVPCPRPGVVALQNVHVPLNWLAIFQGQTVGTVRAVSSYSCFDLALFWFWGH